MSNDSCPDQAPSNQLRARPDEQVRMVGWVMIRL